MYLYYSDSDIFIERRNCQHLDASVSRPQISVLGFKLSITEESTAYRPCPRREDGRRKRLC